MKSNVLRFLEEKSLSENKNSITKGYADLISAATTADWFNVARADRQLGELSNEPTGTAASSRNRIAGSMVGLLPDLQLEADQSEMQIRLLQRQM